jgi:hypothetical protein
MMAGKVVGLLDEGPNSTPSCFTATSLPCSAVPDLQNIVKSITGRDLCNVLRGDENRVRRAGASFDWARKGALTVLIAARVLPCQEPEAQRLPEFRETQGKVMPIS